MAIHVLVYCSLMDLSRARNLLYYSLQIYLQVFRMQNHPCIYNVLRQILYLALSALQLAVIFLHNHLQAEAEAGQA